MSVIFIFLITFILRIFLLSKGPFHWDVVDFLFEMKDKTINPYGATAPFPSLIVVILGYIKDLLGIKTSYLKILLTSVAFISSLSSVMIYLLFKKIFNKKLAIAYSLVFSFIPAFFSVTTFGRIDYAFLSLFLPFAIYSFLKGKYFFTILFTSLCIASRAESGILILGYLSVIILEGIKNKTSKKSISIFKKISRYVILPVLFYILLGFLIGKEKWWEALVLTNLKLKESSGGSLFTGISFSRCLYGLKLILKMVGLLGGLFFTLGISKKILEKDFKNVFLFSLPMLASLIYVVNTDAFSPRYLIFSLFFVSFFISYGINIVSKRKEISFLLSIVIGLLMFKDIFPTVYYRHKHAHQVNFAKYVETITKPHSIIIAQDEEILLRYYIKGDRKILSHPTTCKKKEWEKFFTEIKNALANNINIYVIETGFTYDFCKIFRKFVLINFNIKPIGAHINEDWHHKSIRQQLFLERIFKLIPRYKKIRFIR